VSLEILVGFQYFMPSHKPPPPTETTQPATVAPGTEAPATTEGVSAPGEAKPTDEIKDRASVLATVARIKIEAPRVHGSIALTGARFDDLTLKDYRETLEADSPAIVLLSPSGTKDPYFAEFGWVPKDQSVAVPDAKTVWRADRNVLTPDAPVTLSWDNGAGLRFTRKLAVDADYVFTVTQRVENTGDKPVELFPFGQIQRFGIPTNLANFYVLQEGPLGVLNGVLTENKYDGLLDMQGCGFKEPSTGGWLGITDKYWLTALIPDQAAKLTAEFGSALGTQAGTCEPRFKTNYLREAMTIQPGASAEVTDRLFAGAKVVGLLNRYEDELGVPRFDDAVDFGWLWFLTKPMFYTIDFFYRNVGNFGIAILLLTVCVRILLFPLANKAYVSMSKMRKLQPEMLKLKERYKDDKPRFQQELMALYKREKANPISGCFPILVQVPVFFALYKVLLVSLEMRHAPFFWWIQDLSAPDPMTLITGFGYLDWPAPHFLLIGIWPLIYAFTLFMQQKLNPQPLDPMQQKILLALPLIFLFMFAQFPAGLVIYWTWNNVLSITQQYIIMRRMGVTKAALRQEHAELAALKAELSGGKNGIDKTPLPASKMAAAALAAGNPRSGSPKKAKPVAAAAPAPNKKKHGLFKRDKGKSWPKPEPEVETRQMRRARERTKPGKRPS
jgi:YidC/Oxa1 family membrane protein insertase